MSYPQVPNSLSHLKFKRINSRKCYYYEDSNVMILKSYNTIVAAADKVTKNVYIDEWNYSSYTNQHISFFIHSTIGFNYKYLIRISQSHLIKNILQLLNGVHYGLFNLKCEYQASDFVKLYRLHHRSNKIVQITGHGCILTYASRVYKGCKEDYLTPTYYHVNEPNSKYAYTIIPTKK